jgi:hypothetical protein
LVAVRIIAYLEAASARQAVKKTARRQTMKDLPVIEVRIWEQRVGVIALDPVLGYYAFGYNPAWQRAGIELAPLTLPLNSRSSTFVFPNLLPFIKGDATQIGSR